MGNGGSIRRFESIPTTMLLATYIPIYVVKTEAVFFLVWVCVCVSVCVCATPQRLSVYLSICQSVCPGCGLSACPETLPYITHMQAIGILVYSTFKTGQARQRKRRGCFVGWLAGCVTTPNQTHTHTHIFRLRSSKPTEIRRQIDRQTDRSRPTPPPPPRKLCRCKLQR